MAQKTNSLVQCKKKNQPSARAPKKFGPRNMGTPLGALIMKLRGSPVKRPRLPEAPQRTVWEPLR